MTREIPLPKGFVALVDDEDYERVASAGPWHRRRHGHTTYAQRDIVLPDGRRSTQQMHNFITGVRGLDHANGDGLDNRRCNLRLADQSRNAANNRRRSDNTSGYRGVVREGKRWRAQIGIGGGVKRYLGAFDSPEEAAAAFNAAATELWGEFARLNDIPTHPKEN